MEDYTFEEGPSLSIATKPIYGGYRKRLIDKMVTNTPGTLYKLVKFPGNTTATLNNRLQKVFDDTDAIIPLASVSKVELSPDHLRRDLLYHPEKYDIVEPELDLTKAYKDDLPIPVMEGKKISPVPDLSEVKTLHKDFLFGPDIASTKALQIWYPSEHSVATMHNAHTMSDINNAGSTTSTVISIPFNLKLTDKHLAQMVPVVPRDIIWPPCWKFNEKLGSFVCVVDRIDEKNYEFKVILMAGPYTDDNDTLVKLMKLFNPLYHMYGEQLNREATLEMSKTLVTNAATEFFGPQIVESCIAVWLSCQRDLSINIKKCSTVLMMNNLKSNAFEFNFKMDNFKMDYTKVNQIRAKKVNNSTYKAHIMEVEELPRPVEASPPKKDNDHNPFVEKKERRDYSAEIKARNEEMAQYMREVKENNQMMYEDLRMFGPAAYGLVPMYNHVRDLHMNVEQLNELFPGFGNLKKYIPEEGRMQG